MFFWLGRDDLQYERMTGTSLARSRTILWCLLNYRRRAEPVTRNGGRRRPSPYYVRVPEEPILPQLNRETTSAGCDWGWGSPSPCLEACSSNCMASIIQTKASSANFRLAADDVQAAALFAQLRARCRYRFGSPGKQRLHHPVRGWRTGEESNLHEIRPARSAPRFGHPSLLMATLDWDTINRSKMTRYRYACSLSADLHPGNTIMMAS